MYAAVAGDTSQEFKDVPKWNESHGITEHHSVKFEEGNEFCSVR